MSSSTRTLRPMRTGEEALLWRLFHDTIHGVNSADYSQAQLQAWSPQTRDMAAWRQRMAEVSPFVVVEQRAASDGAEQAESGQIVGFSDLQSDGLINFLFVHHARQGLGIASQLMDEVERQAGERQINKLHAHVSLTAQPFFARRGFKVVERKLVRVGNIELANALMERSL